MEKEWFSAEEPTHEQADRQLAGVAYGLRYDTERSKVSSLYQETPSDTICK